MERYFLLNDRSTFYDWHLILTAKSTTPPEPKTNLVNIDGINGSLDLSEALTGDVVYNDRTVTASFWTDYGKRADRENILQEILTAVHGRKIKIVDPDYPDYYFYGRVKIKSYSNILPYMTLSLEAICDPWRYAKEETTRKIEVTDVEVNAVIYNHGVKKLCPSIVVEGSVTLGYGNYKSTLSAGTYKITDLQLDRGSNVVTVSGNGSITFVYREAKL